jgi:predicted Zn finger-like uncharacterized protein
MILTCPDCATRYFVDEAKLGPNGRKVRCASCGASWRAEAEGEPLDLTPAEPATAPAAVVSEPVRPADALPKSFRAQQEQRRRTRQAVAAGVVWASLAAGFIAVVLAAVIFRVQVVRLWPRTAGAYAALRLPVNPFGLQPEDVRASPGLKDGHAMLFVQGVERNVEASPRPAAPLQVRLYDRGGAPLGSQTVEVDGGPLKPGEARAFTAAFVDPPVAGATVGVDLVWTPRGRAGGRARLAQTASTAPAAGGLRRPEPVALPPVAQPRMAQPLPVGSPYALPAAARAQSGAAAPIS